MKNIVRSISTQSSLSFFQNSTIADNIDDITSSMPKAEKNPSFIGAEKYSDRTFSDNEELTNHEVPENLDILRQCFMPKNKCNIISQLLSSYGNYNENGVLSIVLPERLDNLSIDLSECCKQFNTKLFCAGNLEELTVVFEFLRKCIRLAFNDAIILFEKKHRKFSLKDKLWVSYILKIVDLSCNNFPQAIIDKPQDYHNYFDNSGLNSGTCLCGGTKPVFCCDPKSNPSKCYCPNGELRNLCLDEECKCFNCYYFNECCIPPRYKRGSNVYRHGGISIQGTERTIENKEYKCCPDTPKTGYPNISFQIKNKVKCLEHDIVEYCDGTPI